MDTPKLFSLEGRTALVTGGSRGIGRMIVEGLLGAGCAKVYISARKADQLAEAALEAVGLHPVAAPVALDWRARPADYVTAIGAALAGAAAGTVVAQNNQRNVCAYSRGNGTYYEAPCP